MSRFLIRKPKPKRKRPEDSFQSKLMKELTYRLRPEVIVAAIPNGGFRHRRTAAILKATGVKRGITDLVFIYEEGQTAWLELKTGKVPLSDEQLGIQYRMKTMGHRHAVARTIDEALTQLDAWELLKPEKIDTSDIPEADEEWFKKAYKSTGSKTGWTR